jgi:geranylgeranyl diphosphate synthase type I
VAKPALDHVAREQAQLQRVLGRFRDDMLRELRRVLAAAENDPLTRPFYGQMAYHLGWVDAQFQPLAPPATGKLLRPALVLWACRLAALATGADSTTWRKRHHQALAAAAAVELVHNFSLIHDDIEDGDRLRHGRPALWCVWGESQAINTGDGMFALARLTLWESVARGLPAKKALALAKLLDATCLRLCEGQYRDMAAEASDDVTPDLYVDMIARKTAALMQAATIIGGTIGAPNSITIPAALGEFGQALGLAFQMRDDLLGIWAAHTELGKSPAGDVRRKKMTLPVMHALAHANAADRARLRAIYRAPAEPNDDDIAYLLDLLEEVSHAWCRAQLAAQCAAAQTALNRACGPASDSDAAASLRALIDYIAIAARERGEVPGTDG